MFGKRPDATLVRDLNAMRRFLPYISPRRNDSLFYMSQDIRVDAAFEFIKEKNKQRPRNRPITLFHLYLRSVSTAIFLRPGVNRFVKAGRLWQRDGVWVTFSAKRKLVDGAPMITIKRRFSPVIESLDEMTDATYELLRAGRAGKQTTSDKEVRLLLRLPGPLIRTSLAIVRFADYFGLLPRKMIDAGLKPAIATDFNPGSSMTESLQIILTIACLKLKLTPLEAFEAVTLNAAKALNRGDSIGSLDAGMKADIVIWNAHNHKQIPYHYGVNNVRTVIKGGEVVYSV